MLDRMIVNTAYLVRSRVKKFKEQHPEEEVIISDGTKARKMSSNQDAQYEMGWATARRDVLMLTAINLRCGDWVIPLSTIQEATLLHISGGSLLKVSTSDGEHYQFGLQRNPAWEKQTLIPLKVEQGALGFSIVSLVFRLLVLVAIANFTVQIYLANGFSLSFILGLLIIAWLVSPLLRLIKFPKAQ